MICVKHDRPKGADRYVSTFHLIFASFGFAFLVPMFGKCKLIYEHYVRVSLSTLRSLIMALDLISAIDCIFGHLSANAEN